MGEGGPTALVEDGRTGRLCPPDAGALADAVVALAADSARRGRLARAALAAVRTRTWERSLGQLAAGYGRALGAGVASARQAA
jgi:glycosyltransferase involved in cell wall biosynthesis